MAIHLAEMLIEKINAKVAAEEQKQSEKTSANHINLKPRQGQPRNQDPQAIISDADRA